MRRSVVVSDHLFSELAGTGVTAKRDEPVALGTWASLAALIVSFMGLAYGLLLLLEAGATQVSQEIGSPTEAYQLAHLSEEFR